MGVERVGSTLSVCFSFCSSVSVSALEVVHFGTFGKLGEMRIEAMRQWVGWECDFSVWQWNALARRHQFLRESNKRPPSQQCSALQ